MNADANADSNTLASADENAGMTAGARTAGSSASATEQASDRDRDRQSAAPPAALSRAFAALAAARTAARQGVQPALREVGRIASVTAGIARVSGLPDCRLEELLSFPGGVKGIAFNLDEGEIGAVLLGDYATLQAGDRVQRSGRVMDVAVGDALLGRVIDPLGRALDGGGVPRTSARLPIERPAPAIMDRAPVDAPLQTGIKVIDALIPVGRGQRELILGDRQTGKSAIAVDAILNQGGQSMLCVYCAIGQRGAAVARVVARLRQGGALPYTVVMAADASGAPGLSYIAPYAATSIAEHFMEQGRDVLIVYDDLTRHARAYRELALLLRRPPGREAFPGDVFYLHSRLLERATHLGQARGGGSLTALPVIETDAQNIAAYIPTNLISITDGQIYLSPALFELGALPAVDVGRSVSRVGGKAQLPALRAAAGDLKLDYAQYEELENFSRFGARLDAPTLRRLEHGRRIRACLRQDEGDPWPVAAQIALLQAVNAGLFDAVDPARIAEALDAVRQSAGAIASGAFGSATGSAMGSAKSNANGGAAGVSAPAAAGAGVGVDAGAGAGAAGGAHGAKGAIIGAETDRPAKLAAATVANADVAGGGEGAVNQAKPAPASAAAGGPPPADDSAALLSAARAALAPFSAVPAAAPQLAKPGARP